MSLVVTSELGLQECETVAYREHDQIHQLAQALIREVRSLRHQLNDPEYIYGNGRISRAAIVCRKAENDKLREALKKYEHPED